MIMCFTFRHMAEGCVPSPANALRRKEYAGWMFYACSCRCLFSIVKGVVLLLYGAVKERNGTADPIGISVRTWIYDCGYKFSVGEKVMVQRRSRHAADLLWPEVAAARIKVPSTPYSC